LHKKKPPCHESAVIPEPEAESIQSGGRRGFATKLAQK